MYAIIVSDARQIGKKPALKLGWVARVNPDGSARVHLAAMNTLENPRWSTTLRTVRKNQIAQLFGPNVKPSAAEVRAIRARMKPYEPARGEFDKMGHKGGV